MHIWTIHTEIAGISCPPESGPDSVILNWISDVKKSDWYLNQKPWSKVRNAKKSFSFSFLYFYFYKTNVGYILDAFHKSIVLVVGIWASTRRSWWSWRRNHGIYVRGGKWSISGISQGIFYFAFYFFQKLFKVVTWKWLSWDSWTIHKSVSYYHHFSSWDFDSKKSDFYLNENP